MIILDANLILRYLLNDNEEMADTAERFLNTGNAYVTIEVIAEVVYVLKGVYSMKRTVIADVIHGFMRLVKCQEPAVLDLALDTYRKHSIDFVDCVLYGYHQVKGAEIATFDKKLLKLIHA